MAGYIWAVVGWYYCLYPKDIACYCVGWIQQVQDDCF